MGQRAEQLHRLQSLDLEIARLSQRLTQINASLGDQIKIRAADLATRQAEKALRDRITEQRDREFELTTIENRIKDHTERLYSGKGSPKDLQALQRDIEHDQTRKGEAEERALTAMEATEKARAEVARIKAAVDRVLGELASGNVTLVGERETVRASLEKRNAERSALAQGIDAVSMALYDRLRQRLPDGVAVAEVSQNRCEGCRTVLPAVEEQRARRSEGLVQCSTCQRILDVPPG